MIVIRTRYKRATNHQGARIVARSSNGVTLAMPYYESSLEIDNHKQACFLLWRKLGLDYIAGYNKMYAGEFNGEYYWIPIDNGSPHCRIIQFDSQPERV